jgi:catechol 2,3-dioxygenase-like lactoylglutathione lyase family enzyme
MAIGMTKVLHVKIPVTDLQRSVTWYASLMDLELSKEFIEQGELRGAALTSPEGGLRLRCGSGSTVPAPRCWTVSTSRHAHGLARGTGATS